MIENTCLSVLIKTITGGGKLCAHVKLCMIWKGPMLKFMQKEENFSSSLGILNLRALGDSYGKMLSGRARLFYPILAPKEKEKNPSQTLSRADREKNYRSMNQKLP